MGDKSKDYVMWLEFFRNAGIGSTFDKKYAFIFDENRMKMDMLSDLNKEYLKEMGISAMGDIISILKHSKRIHDEAQHAGFESKKELAASSTSEKKGGLLALSSPSISTSINNRTTTEKSSFTISANKAATSTVPQSSSGKQAQMIQKTVLKSVSTSAIPNIKQTVSMIGFNSIQPNQAKKRKPIVFDDKKTLQEEVPVQKKIRVLPEHEGPYKIKMPEGTIPRTQKLLQSRLICNKPATTSLNVNGSPKSGIFSRLGGNNESSAVPASVSSNPIRQSALLRLSTTIATSPASKSEPAEPVKRSAFSRLGGKYPSNPDIVMTAPLITQEPREETKPIVMPVVKPMVKPIAKPMAKQVVKPALRLETKNFQNATVTQEKPVAKVAKRLSEVPKKIIQIDTQKNPQQLKKIEVRIDRKSELSKLYSLRDEPQTSMASRLGDKNSLSSNKKETPKETFRVEFVNTQAKALIEKRQEPPPPRRKEETLTTKLFEQREELKRTIRNDKVPECSTTNQQPKSKVVDSRPSSSTSSESRKKVNYHSNTTNRRHDDSSASSSKAPARKIEIFSSSYRSKGKTEESYLKSDYSRSKPTECKRHESSRSSYSSKRYDSPNEEVVRISRNSSLTDPDETFSRDWRRRMPEKSSSSSLNFSNDSSPDIKGNPKGIIKPIDDIMIKHIRLPPSETPKKGSVKFSENVETFRPTPPLPSTSQPKMKSQKIVGRLSKNDGLSSQHGRVLRTEKIPSATKGKCIVRKYVVKKVKKGSAAAASKAASSRQDRDSLDLPDIDDPLEHFFDSDEN